MEKELTLSEIERRYPDQWVLIEETAWDEKGNPERGFVRAHSVNREGLEGPLKELHKRLGIKTSYSIPGKRFPKTWEWSYESQLGAQRVKDLKY